jgi:integrase
LDKDFEMARTAARNSSLSSRSARAKLAKRNKPYFVEIVPSKLHLGWRATSSAWIGRFYMGAGVYENEALGVKADDTLNPDGTSILSFAQAQERLRTRYAERERAAAAPAEPERAYTVGDAIAEHLAYMEANRKSAADARYRAAALILPALGHVACASLTRDQIVDWLNGMVKAAPRVRTRKGKPQQYRAISGDDESIRARKASANRSFYILKPALNRAWREDKITSDKAWRTVKPFENVERARVRYLTIDEAQRLINAAEGEFRDLVQAALLTGCRYGELSRLDVEDFAVIRHGDVEVGQVHVRKSKTGPARHVVLNAEGLNFFRALAAGRHGSDPMLPHPRGGRWLKSNQNRPMAEACQRGSIKPPASFHTARHTYASLAIMAGVPLLVVAKNLGHKDTRMVEKHYGHLSPSYIADEIRRAAPRFGIAAGNVAPLRGAR